MSVDISLVINTYNRAHLVAGAITSALEQRTPFREVIVVDDGSTDDTATVLKEFGDRIVAVRQDNAGLCAARNRGLAEATSDWVGFLDDDDFLLPDVVQHVTELVSPGVGAVCGGLVYREPRSGRATFAPPVKRDRTFSERVWNYMPGSFFVSLDLLAEIGGYRPELRAQHQTDLIWRLSDVLDRERLSVVATPVPFVVMERGDYVNRPLMQPESMLSGTQNMLEQHAHRFEREREVHADYLAIVGVNHVRMGDAAAGRAAIYESARVSPSSRSLARAALAATPGAGAWRWNRVSTRNTPHQGQSDRRPSSASLDSQLRNTNDLLPGDYTRNPQASSEAHGTNYWSNAEASQDDRHQVPVYRLADRLARKHGFVRLMDIGCGSGTKAATLLASNGRHVVGVDQPSAIQLATKHLNIDWVAADLSNPQAWHELATHNPQLAICADVIEHLDCPHALLDGLRRLLSEDGLLVLSTPDRTRSEADRPKGPPANPRHVMEWAPEEMTALLTAHDFDVVELHHLLPRSYSATSVEAKRVVWRSVHRRAIPDRRRCMTFVARPCATP